MTEAPLTRRQFLREAVEVGSGLALAMVFGACQDASSDDVKFIERLSGLSLKEKIKVIDEEYSKRSLSKAMATEHVVPVWVEAYIQASGSKLTSQDILSRLDLNPPKKPDRKPDEEPGGVTIDFNNRQFTAFYFDFTVFQSNQTRKHPISGEPTSGITYLRSGLVHELVHFDTKFRDDKELGELMAKNAVVTPPVLYPDGIFNSGFSVFHEHPDKSANLYFNNFDENMSDVISSYIGERLGGPSIMAYGFAPVYRGFLDWIQFPPDQLLALHRESDFRTLAKELGRFSALKRRLPATDEDKLTLDGIQVVKAMNSANSQQIESYFPGVNQAVINRPQRFVR